MAKNYWTPGQLARLLNVSPKTISRWIAEGKIVHYRTLGGNVARGHARIPDAEKDRLMLRFAAEGRVELDEPASVSQPEPSRSTTPVPAGGQNGVGRA